jgi:hypothetical protein
MIYVASPYSHPDEAVREKRYLAAFNYCAAQLINGLVVFSPIVYGHLFSTRFGIAGDYLTWQRFNDEMLLACNEIHILCLPGWKESKGVAHELALAAQYNIGLRIGNYEDI